MRAPPPPHPLGFPKTKGAAMGDLSRLNEHQRAAWAKSQRNARAATSAVDQVLVEWRLGVTPPAQYCLPLHVVTDSNGQRGVLDG